jgi:hypothetical protein
VNRHQYFEKKELLAKKHNNNPIAFPKAEEQIHPLIVVESRKNIVEPFEIPDKQFDQLPH